MSQGQTWNFSASRTFDHDANGYRGAVGCSVEFWVSGTSLHANSAGAGTQPALDYVRTPSAPSFSAITRNIDDFTVSLNAVSSPAGTPTYYIQRSQNGGAWGDDRATQSTTFADLPKGSTQQFRAAAYNSDGWSGWTYSSVYTVPNVPDAPTPTGVTLAPGRIATITAGTPASNGGTAITAFYVQASADDGVTWQAAQLMTGQSYTYTGLTAGATYKFRTYAVNEMGQSAYSTSASTKIPAGLKIKTGASTHVDALAVKVKVAENTWVEVSALKIKTASGFVESI